FGGSVLQLHAGLALTSLIVQGGTLPAHAASAPALQQSAPGTASNRPPETDTLPAPARLGGAPDLAYAAYQRGYYVTAMREAMKRIDADPGDGPAMTLIGHLYSRGLRL